MVDTQSPSHPSGVDLSGVTDVCLIGGGDLMVDTGRALAKAGYRVTAVLAPRHRDEALPRLGGTLAQTLGADGIAVHLAEDINRPEDWDRAPGAAGAGAAALALCFGPAWIFSDAVRAAFGFGMFNVNPIPIPRYLGGAHFTWQILNGDRSGGCFLQEITAELDRGPILDEHLYLVPESARVPEDYFIAMFEEGRRFLRRVIEKMKDGVPFTPVPFETVNDGRLYFPRLFTSENGIIDWSWTVDEIERFCCAFDRPYDGAATFIDGALVRLKDVAKVEDDADLHPFSAGLVVRRLGPEAVVAAAGGYLRVGSARDTDGADAMALLREGRRLHTPRERLDHALSYRPRLVAKGFVAGEGS